MDAKIEGAGRVDEVTVDLGDRSYPILVGAGVLGATGTRLRSLVRGDRCAVVTNPTVAALYREPLAASLAEAGFAPLWIEVPDGEVHKNLASLSAVYDQLVAARFERSAPLIALGGGVIGDLTGFAAATYLRGVPFVQVPTTLLAQVDSSVGGKTGVNHPGGKNLIGAFHQPRLVVADTTVLRSLPPRELRAGLAEVIKYGAILDADLFARLETDMDRLLALEEASLRQVVRRSCELKAAVVGADERETEYRAILNFGHTLGHAVESVTGYERFLHGEAVAIGMVFAARLSAARGWFRPEEAARIRALVESAGLPTEVPADLEALDLAAAMASDKKVAAARVRFVALDAIGRTRFEWFTSEELAGAIPGRG